MLYPIRFFHVILIFCLSSITPAHQHQAGSQPPPSEEAALRALVQRFYAAYVNKDLEVFLSLWSAKSPELESRKLSMPRLFAEYDNLELKSLQIDKIIVREDTASVTFELDTSAAEAGSRKPAADFGKSRRALHSIKEDRTWKVWREGSLEEHLAAKLIEAKTEQERQALLAAEKELVTVKLRKALITLGRRESYLSNYPAALAIYGIAREVVAQIDDRDGVADVLIGVGTVYERQGDFASALDHFRNASAQYQEAGNQESLAFALERIGGVHRKQGDLALALEYSRNSLELAESGGYRDVELSTLMSLGNVYYSLGEFNQALMSYEKVLPLFEKLNRKMGISYALTNIGNIRYMQGDYRQALDFYHKSLAIEESVSDRSGSASSMANIGLVHRQQGNYDVALDFYNRSLSLRETLGEKAGIANTLNYIGNVHYRRGNQAQALEYFQRSLAIKQTLGDKLGIVSSLYGIGQFHQSQGDLRRALDFYEKSLALAESSGSRQWIANVLLGVAEAHHAQGSYPTALECANRATLISREIGSREMLWESLTIAGRVHRSRNDPAAARQAFDEAIANIEELRLQVPGSEQGRQRFFENKVSPYQEMVGLLVAQGNRGEAFSYAERARGRALLDVLNSGRINVTKAMSGQEQEREQKLKTELVSLNSQISRENRNAKPDALKLRDLDGRLNKARVEYEAFQARLYALHPDLRVRRGETEIATAEEVRRVLPDGRSSLLEYVVAEDKTYLFAVTKSESGNRQNVNLNVYTLEIKRKKLAEQVSAFRNQLANRDIAFRESASRLYDLLVKPAQGDLNGSTTLVIAPDSSLWELPFQALQSDAGRYLLEDHIVSYVPSLTVLREMTTLRNKKPGIEKATFGLLGFANPALDRQTVEPGKPPRRDERLDPLPEAEREVKILAQLYGAKHSRVYLGAQAREDLLKSEAGKFGVLHLATHGILNDLSPMYSQIVLAQGQKTANEDGLLEAWEIMKLDLNSDLVVLSACETGRGRTGAGEGLIGFAWAVFVAGSPTSVVSQWKVESTSTTELMLRFHRNLRIGAQNPAMKMTKARALREAAIGLLRTKEYRHPFYWAAFVLIGDGG